MRRKAKKKGAEGGTSANGVETFEKKISQCRGLGPTLRVFYTINDERGKKDQDHAKGRIYVFERGKKTFFIKKTGEDMVRAACLALQKKGRKGKGNQGKTAIKQVVAGTGRDGHLPRGVNSRTENGLEPKSEDRDWGGREDEGGHCGKVPREKNRSMGHKTKSQPKEWAVGHPMEKKEWVRRKPTSIHAIN